MKVEFVPDGSPECPLLRIYDYNDAQINAMRWVVAGLSTATDISSVSEKFEVDEVGMLSFSMRLGLGNGAFFDKGHVEWTGDQEYWLEIAALMDEMLVVSQSRNRYQWLSGPMAYYESQGVSVLLTELQGGQW